MPGMDATWPLAIDRVTAVAMTDGDHLEVDGSLVSSLDGTVFGPAVLFDYASGGLRVVDATPDGAMLAPTGVSAAACTAVGASTPCLVPRLGDLAHARLRTVAEFAPTLSGTMSLTLRKAPAPVVTPVARAASVWLGAACMMGACAWMALAFWRSRSKSALGRVRAAARRALRATRGDGTLEPVRRQVRALVERAAEAEGVRRAAARALRRAPAVAAVPPALPLERTEVLRLEADRATASAELERIASALRVVALRARSSPRRRGADPVDALVGELDLRDEAAAEAEEVR